MVPHSWRRWLPLAAVLTAVWLLCWGFAVGHADRSTALDRWIDPHLLAERVRVGPLVSQLADLGDASRFVIIVIALLVACAAARAPQAAIACLVSLAVEVTAVEYVFKPLIARRLHGSLGYAFPSGHTAAATAVATLVILLIGRSTGPLGRAGPRPVRALIVTVVVLAVPAVGLSMVAIGAHRITDVIGAGPVGAVLTVLTCAAVDSAARRYARRSRRTAAATATEPELVVSHTPSTDP